MTVETNMTQRIDPLAEPFRPHYRLEAEVPERVSHLVVISSHMDSVMDDSDEALQAAGAGARMQEDWTAYFDGSCSRMFQQPHSTSTMYRPVRYRPVETRSAARATRTISRVLQRQAQARVVER